MKAVAFKLHGAWNFNIQKNVQGHLIYIWVEGGAVDLPPQVQSKQFLCGHLYIVDFWLRLYFFNGFHQLKKLGKNPDFWFN